MRLHTPPDMTRWQGRTDTEEGALALRWRQRVGMWSENAEPGIALLGFACDAGVVRNQGRPGAKEGPDAIRRALANLAWRDRGPVYDAGDIVCVGDELEAAQTELAQFAGKLLTTGQFPLILGGGHEMAYGSFLGLVSHAATQQSFPVIGIINLDAHFDLRASQRGNSGTPFRQIADYCQSVGRPFHYLIFGVAEPSNTMALFQRARELGATWRSDEECIRENLSDLRSELMAFAEGVDWLYLTICLDVLPGAFAPGVSAPAVGGVEIGVVEALIDAAKSTGKLRIADIAELNPAFDRDNQTAKAAARLIWRIARQN